MIGISIPSFIALIGGILTYEYINDVKKRQELVLIADDLKEHVLEVRRNEKISFITKMRNILITSKLRHQPLPAQSTAFL